MEDFGGHNIRTNAEEVLKRYGPMTGCEVVHMLEPETEYGTERFYNLKNRVCAFFNQDMKRYGCIELYGKKLSEHNHQYENIYRWIG